MREYAIFWVGQGSERSSIISYKHAKWLTKDWTQFKVTTVWGVTVEVRHREVGEWQSIPST